MPDIRNCRRCKRIFMYVGGPQICEDCKKQEEEKYEKVRLFLKDFPGATIQEVSQETEVETKLIYKFLKEGRLEISSTSPIALLCEQCGRRINSGRFCIDCSKKLANEMIIAGKSLKQRSKDEKTGEARGLRYIHGRLKE
jgi:flagellar operon protein (TIGR03826 family)